MKKILAFGFSMVAVLTALSGCGGASSSQAENRAAQTSKVTINDLLAESQAQQPFSSEDSQGVQYPSLDYSAEVDLTELNANMTYSTVYDMTTNLDSYVGKSVKADGTFDVFTNPDTGEMFYACIIADATACCSQGLEFKLEGEHSYPDDYPAVGAPITVGGIYETYEYHGQIYCRLKNAKLAV